MSRLIPSNYEESKQWIDVRNIGDKTIEPFAPCAIVSSVQDPSEVIGVVGIFDRSVDQDFIGQLYQLAVNSPLAIEKGQHGRVSMDFPLIANTSSSKYSYSPGNEMLPMEKSFGYPHWNYPNSDDPSDEDDRGTDATYHERMQQYAKDVSLGVYHWFLRADRMEFYRFVKYLDPEHYKFSNTGRTVLAYVERSSYVELRETYILPYESHHTYIVSSTMPHWMAWDVLRSSDSLDELTEIVNPAELFPGWIGNGSKGFLPSGFTVDFSPSITGVVGYKPATYALYPDFNEEHIPFWWPRAAVYDYGTYELEFIIKFEFFGWQILGMTGSGFISGITGGTTLVSGEWIIRAPDGMGNVGWVFVPTGSEVLFPPDIAAHSTFWQCYVSATDIWFQADIDGYGRFTFQTTDIEAIVAEWDQIFDGFSWQWLPARMVLMMNRHDFDNAASSSNFERIEVTHPIQITSLETLDGSGFDYPIPYFTTQPVPSLQHGEQLAGFSPIVLSEATEEHIRFKAIVQVGRPEQITSDNASPLKTMLEFRMYWRSDYMTPPAEINISFPFQDIPSSDIYDFRSVGPPASLHVSVRKLSDDVIVIPFSNTGGSGGSGGGSGGGGSGGGGGPNPEPPLGG